MLPGYSLRKAFLQLRKFSKLNLVSSTQSMCRNWKKMQIKERLGTGRVMKVDTYKMAATSSLWIPT